MFEDIYRVFRNGYERLKRFSTILYERTRVEIAVIKMLNDVHVIDRRIEENYRIIGRRLRELYDIHEKDVLRDDIIVQAFKEIQRLTEEREDLIKKSSELAGDMRFMKEHE